MYREKGYLSTQKEIRDYYYWFAFRKWLISHTKYFYELEPSGYGDIHYELMNEKMHQSQKKLHQQYYKNEVMINTQYMSSEIQKIFLADENYIDIKQPYRGKNDIFSCLLTRTNIQSIKTEVNVKDNDFNPNTIILVVSNNLETLKYFKLKFKGFVGTATINKMIKLFSNSSCKYVLEFDIFYDDKIDYENMKCNDFVTPQLEQIHNTENHKKFYDENILCNKKISFLLNDSKKNSKIYTQWYTLIKWCHSYRPHNYIKTSSFGAVLVFTNIEKNTSLIKIRN